MAANIRKQGNTYYARFQVPADVRRYFGGKREVWETLETGDKATALLRAGAKIALQKAKVAELRGRTGTLAAEASWWRDHLRDHSEHGDEPMAREAMIGTAARTFLPGGSSELAAHLDAHDGDELSVIAEHGGPAAKRFLEVAARGATPTDEYLPVYMERRGKEVEAKTAAMDVADLRLFADAFPLLEGVTRAGLSEWIDKQLAGGLSAATMRRKLTAIRRYWHWLIERKHLEQDRRSVFEKLTFKGSAKEASKSKWLPFTPKEVASLHAAALNDKDEELADLIAVAAYTGARIEEICALAIEHVDLAGGAFAIDDAKTEAGHRVVPIHSKLKPLLKRLIGDRKSGYIFAMLKPTKYGDRSGAIGKRFGRLKTGLGFAKRQVFHSIRKCFTTQLEQAEVLENVTADIIGHEKPRTTYKVYSGGTSMAQRRKAVALIQYPKPL